MRNQRGFILISVMSIVAFLILAGASLLTRGVWQMNTGSRLYNRVNALSMAEAAIEQSSRNLRSAATSDDIMSADISTGSFTIGTMENLGNLRYRTTVTGTSITETRNVEAIFQLTAESVFQFALFGDLIIDVDGNIATDSYDSSLGLYNDDPADPDYNKAHHGDIGTNSTAAGGVSFDGRSLFIDGQVAVGYGVIDPYSVVEDYDPLFVTGGTDPPSDSQDVVTQPSAFPLTSVSVPAGVTCADHAIGGGTVETLSPTGGDNGDGVYCFNNLFLDGRAKLTASGDVQIYITGSLLFSGNSQLGYEYDPGRMLVMITDTGSADFIDGNPEFYGAFYAPESTITVSGTADIYGSIIAEQINVAGTANIHYDESIAELDDITNLFSSERISWQEI